MSRPIAVTTPAQGRGYAKRLIEDAYVQHSDDARRMGQEHLLYTLVANDLLDPYREGVRAEHYSRCHRLVVGRVTVELCEGALHEFNTAIFAFVVRHQDVIDDATIEAFLGDS